MNPQHQTNQLPADERKRIRRLRWLITVAAVCAVVFVAGLVFGNYLQIAVEGLSYFSRREDRYAYSCETLTDECTFTVDLTDLDANVGKVIWRGEDGWIEIDAVQYMESPRAEDYYRIFFTSHGTFSLNEAVLVSGVMHEHIEGNVYSLSLLATLTGTYEGRTFEGSVAGMGGGVRNGDHFGYYLYPAEIFGENAAVGGTVELTMTGLQRNLWSEN